MLTSRPVLNLSLRKKYLVLREIVVWLGLFEYLGLGGALFFLGAEDFLRSGASLAMMGSSYYISTKLSWYTNELLIRLATGRE